MSETLTRAELAELIYSEVGISKTEASEIVDQFFEEIILDLIDGNSVKLTSFGSLIGNSLLSTGTTDPSSR